MTAQPLAVPTPVTRMLVQQCIYVYFVCNCCDETAFATGSQLEDKVYML